MSVAEKRGRRVAPAEVAEARETVRRFLSRGRFTGTFESLNEGAPVSPPSDDELRAMVQQVAAAASADPLAYSILGGKRSERELHADLSGAFAAVHAAGQAPQLSVAERSALEAISLLTGRPALLVTDDSFQLPSGVWELLAPYRPELQTLLKAVGRLEVPSMFGMPYAGTAFVVGPGLVMTNRHVLDYLYTPTEQAADGSPAAWEFIPDMSMTLDFKKEYGSDKRSEFQVTGIAAVFPEHGGAHDVDLALLKVSTNGLAGQSWPAAVRIQSNTECVKTDARVCVAGYPGADESRNDKAEMDRIYGSVYQVKRLAPGKIIAVDRERRSLSHDCTTLGGNSGSCVFDLDTNSVLGLHWGGDYLQPNFAVLLPQLFSDPPDPRLIGVNFQGD